MSDRKVYLLTEEEVSMLRRAGMFTQPQPTFFQALAQDVRCKTCRHWNWGECEVWKNIRAEYADEPEWWRRLLIGAVSTCGCDTSIETEDDFACSMWEARP